MLRIDIPEKKIKRYLPTHLGECDKYQYINMCGLIYKYMHGLIDLTELKTTGLYFLLNMKRKHAPFGIGDDEKFGNISMLADKLDLFFETDDFGRLVIYQDYIDNKVPTFRPSIRKLHGPENSFTNFTFGEYREAVRLFNDYEATQDTFLLYMLSALMYRPKTFFKIDKYDAHKAEKRAKMLKKYAPMGFIWGNYLWFASFQKYLVSSEILWNGQNLDLSIIFELNEQSNETFGAASLPGIGMDSIAFAMAESGAFGTLKDVDATNMWVMLVRMYELKRNELVMKSKTTK